MLLNVGTGRKRDVTVAGIDGAEVDFELAIGDMAG